MLGNMACAEIWNCISWHTILNSKCIKDLDARAETIKYLEENAGRILFHLTFTGIFNDMSAIEGKQNQK